MLIKLNREFKTLIIGETAFYRRYYWSRTKNFWFFRAKYHTCTHYGFMWFGVSLPIATLEVTP
jgi:hypothetical protein